MQVGERREVKVRAREPWNDTNIDVVGGGVYRFAAEGHWLDMIVLTDADGYDSVLLQHQFESMRRVEHRKWFTLIGTIGKDDDTAFMIGKSRTWPPPARGRISALSTCCDVVQRPDWPKIR